MGSKVFGVITLAIFGVIGADILLHPTGTAQAGNSIAAVWKPVGNSLLGYKN